MKKSYTILPLMLILFCFFNMNTSFGQTITNLGNLTFVEGSANVLVDSDITISGGTNYGEGYLQFSLTGGSSGDNFGTTSDADVNAAGAISFASGICYLGNGTSRDPIGNIDATLNGLNGNDLRINFTSNFENGSFETGTLDGWTAMNQFINLGSTSIAGWPSPNDTRDNDAPQYASYYSTIETSEFSAGTQSLRLRSSMSTAGGCDYVHGPAVYSDVFQAASGDILKFDWRAFQGSDAYSVFVYLLNSTTGTTQTIINQTSSGSTSWTTSQVAVPSTGSYQFVFVSGTWDATCGLAAGASLYIDNVIVSGSRVVDAVITNIARKINYQWACGTSTDRTLTVSAKTTTGTTFSASSTISITLGPDLVVGSISADQTICYDDQPNELNGVAPTGGNTPYTYQWQSSTNGSTFSDISGATGLDFQPGDLTATTYYQLNQTTASGCETETTNTVTITVYNDFTPGAILTTGEAICYNADPGIIGSSTAASGGDGTITYKWESSTDGFATAGSVISGATSATYDPPSGITATTSYRRYAHDGTCNTSFEVSTGTWVITYYSEFTPGAILTTGEIFCNSGGNPASIGNSTVASGGDGTITYKWESSTDGFATAGSVISGATSSSYDPPAGLTVTTSYRRYAHDGTCNTTFEVSTGTWLVRVYNEFTPGAIETTGESICFNGDPVLIGSSTAASGGDETITYRWESSTDGFVTAGSVISGATSATYDPPAGLTATTSYRRYAHDGTCNTSFEVSTGTWVVIFYPEFTSGAIFTTGEAICYNTDPSIIGSSTAASGGDGTITYSWESSTDGFATAGSVISGATSATYDPPAGLTVTTSYRRYAHDGSCNTTFEVSSGTWLVTVYPEFIGGSISGTQTICYETTPDELIGVAPTGADGDYTYQWQHSTNGTTFTNISGATSLDYQSGDLTETTHFKLVQTSVYGCGEFTTNSITVNVYPFVPHPVIVEKKMSGNVSILIVDNSQNLYYEYLWSYGNGNDLPFDIVNDRQFLTLPINHMDATYKVTGYDRNSCGVSSLSKTVTPTQMLSSIFPTISMGSVTMNIAGPENGTIHVKFYDDSGQVIKTLQFEKMMNTESKQIQVNDLNVGSYFVEISINNFKEVHRIFVR